MIRNYTDHSEVMSLKMLIFSCRRLVDELNAFICMFGLHNFLYVYSFHVALIIPDISACVIYFVKGTLLRYSIILTSHHVYRFVL